jgi:hypothetical protein
MAELVLIVEKILCTVLQEAHGRLDGEDHGSSR